MVHYVQTVHLSCTKTNNVSKWTEARFHMTHVIKEFHRMHPNWFPHIWYVPCKPCTYLASGLISKLTEPSLHKSLFTQEYQIVRPKWFLRLRCIRRKLCIYLALKLTMSTNGLKQDSIWYTSPRSSIGCIQIDFQAYGMLYANHAPTMHQD